MGLLVVVREVVLVATTPVSSGGRADGVLRRGCAADQAAWSDGLGVEAFAFLGVLGWFAVGGREVDEGLGHVAAAGVGTLEVQGWALVFVAAGGRVAVEVAIGAVGTAGGVAATWTALERVAAWVGLVVAAAEQI